MTTVAGVYIPMFAGLVRLLIFQNTTSVSFTCFTSSNNFFLLHVSALTLLGAISGNGMQLHRRPGFAPRGLIGPSAGFYLVFAYPLHQHIFIQIILFLADEDTGFTIDTNRFAATSPALFRLTVTFREVDTPSLASEESDG